MDLYNRQSKLDLKTSYTVTVVGCGGVGYWVAKYAAMSGINKIYLFDPDVIEENNLNRLDLPPSSIGENKAMITKKFINMIRPDCMVYAIPYKFQEHLFIKTDYIIDCTDKHKVQMEIEAVAKRIGVQYMKAGYDGQHITVADSVSNLWTANEIDGYTVTPSWVVPATVVAAMTVAKIVVPKCQKAEISLNIDEIFNIRKRNG